MQSDLHNYVCIDQNNLNIRFKNISDRDKIEKIVVEVNDRLYSILTDTRTPMTEINNLICNLLDNYEPSNK